MKQILMTKRIKVCAVVTYLMVFVYVPLHHMIDSWANHCVTCVTPKTLGVSIF